MYVTYKHEVNKFVLLSLMQIKYSETLSSLQSTVHDCHDFLAAAGCLRPITALHDKDMLVNDLLIHHVIKRITSPLERFVLFVNFRASFIFLAKTNVCY